MALPSDSQPITAQVSAQAARAGWSDPWNLARRRLLAWSLEVSLLTASTALPWAAGAWVRQQVQDNLVPLNPVSSLVQGVTAAPLGRSRQSLVTQVPPLTNLLWFTALVLPVGLGLHHLHGLATRGKTWPKAWLGLLVVAPHQPQLGYPTALLREGVGRMGLPLGMAYLVWLSSGAFPSLVALAGLSLTASLAGGLTALLDPQGRAVHDRLARTQVQPLEEGQFLLAHQRPKSSRPGLFLLHRFGRLLLPVQVCAEDGGLRSLVFSPTGTRRSSGMIALGAIGLLSLIGLGGLMVGWRRQTEVSRRDQLFLALVENISLNATRFADQQAAALALATSEDPRAVTFLVDLLAQTQSPELLGTLQQALITAGPRAIAPLQRLNRSLTNDLSHHPDGDILARARLQAVQRALMKILVIHSGTLQGLDLGGTNLAQDLERPEPFTLVLEQSHLAGLRWRDARLNGAQLGGAIFFDPGKDGHADTFDDGITDFSGSDLTAANLVAAQISYALFRGGSLLKADLSRAQADHADFSGVNASSARWIASQASQSRFDRASLVGADFTEAQLSQASLMQTRLRRAVLAEANLEAANLKDSDLSEADLTATNLRGANLSQANLSQARLVNTDLRQANLQGVNLQGANLQGARLGGAKLNGANLAGARFFLREQRQPGSFITTILAQEPGDHLAGVDLSKVLNIDPDQLPYLCQQGAVHPDCTDAP
ncbi:MAG: pentapeptide repeat-containing protein [Cyanobacteriota bacterium]|nr:pentapeptide repeat-containing protein [Cyanobacteriota bacterium]